MLALLQNLQPEHALVPTRRLVSIRHEQLDVIDLEDSEHRSPSHQQLPASFIASIPVSAESGRSVQRTRDTARQNGGAIVLPPAAFERQEAARRRCPSTG